MIEQAAEQDGLPVQYGTRGARDLLDACGREVGERANDIEIKM